MIAAGRAISATICFTGALVQAENTMVSSSTSLKPPAPKFPIISNPSASKSALVSSVYRGSWEMTETGLPWRRAVSTAIVSAAACCNIPGYSSFACESAGSCGLYSWPGSIVFGGGLRAISPRPKQTILVTLREARSSLNCSLKDLQLLLWFHNCFLDRYMVSQPSTLPRKSLSA